MIGLPHALFSAALIANAGLCVHAQPLLYPDRSHERGGGTLQTCDTSMHVSIATTLLNGYNCVFDPVIVPGSTQVQDLVWTYYYNGAFTQAYTNPFQLYFPWQEEYPVCLTVNAYDLEAQQPCSTTVCDLITPVSDVLCTSLIANFEIAAVDGQTVTFENTSTFAGLIDQEVWTFGDGAGATTSAPTNTFVGPGPFEICLTLVSSDPYCSATLCQWLYLGPGNVECAQLIDQGYWLLQADNLVGVLDTSRTSGMYSAIDWDFGDGAHATGNVAVHAYPVQGEFQLCGTLRAWGPLLGDTCISTVCHSVWPQLVGLEETPSIAPWSVSPNPCTDAITLWGEDAFLTRVVVLDALGRTVLTPPKSAGVGSARLDLSSLEVGPYLLHLSTPERSSAIRIIKR